MNELDLLLGDPYDDSNECNVDAVMAADERREMAHGPRAVLDRVGFGAEFVPTALGGRFTSTEELIHRLRPVFGRDASLGLGYGLTSFMAAVNVYAVGSQEQRNSVAQTLISGAPISVAYHELDHGNDFGANGLAATADADSESYRLTGTKDVINNADRAHSAVVFARTGNGVGGREHSLFLIDLLAADAPQATARHRSLGLRGCRLSGLDFRDTPVSSANMVGGIGTAVETALKSFQVSRCVAAGAGLGPVDESLFAVTAFTRSRKLYGRELSELPHVRSTLAASFADLMAAESTVMAAADTLHRRPAFGSAHSAAAKFAVPRMLETVMSDLSVVLGARFYLRTGPYSLFGKHFRDFAALAIGHAGGAACQLAILPQLKRLTTAAGPSPTPTAPHTAYVPELSYDALRLTSPGPDPLLGALWSYLLDRPIHPSLMTIHPVLKSAMEDLRIESASLRPQDLGVSASAHAMRLTEKYTQLLVAASIVERATDDLESWEVLALHRIAERVSGQRFEPPPHVVTEAFTEVVRRAREGHAFDLRGRPVPRTMP